MKKLLSFAGVALLALIGVVGCDDDAVVTPVAPPPTPAPIFGTVSGTVSVEGSGLAGVSVNLSGAASQSASTGSSGGYSFDNVPAGTHSVQISGAPDEVTFGSIAAAVTITTSGQAATADFSGDYIRTSIIEGSVTAGGEGVVATVTASGAGRLMSEQANSGSSNADGDFELAGLRAGTYHVEISQFPEGIEFPVTMRDVTVGVGLSANASFDAPGEDGPTTDTGTGMSILITEVTDAGDDDGKYSGRVTAMIDVERGEFAKIALYVDGAEVDAQLFGLGPAPAGEPPLAAQEGVIFSLSFNSAKYNTDIGPDLGKVTYPNGAHEIVAGVTVQGSTEEAYSNRMEVEFDNPDGVHALATLPGDPVFNPDDGKGWYGGPDAGIVVGGTLVSYSGDVVGSLTLLDICGNKPITDSEAPFVFDELECDETRVLTQEDDIFRIAERSVGILNGEGVFPLRLDFEGPGAPRFRPNPNDRQGGWINAMVGLTGENKSSNKDGWLIYGDKGVGVGGYTVRLRVSDETPNAAAGALAAGHSSTPELPAPSKADVYCFVASAVDLLGNESKLPKDNDACVAADVYAAAVAPLSDDDDTNDEDVKVPAGLRAGVDTTDPTIDFTGASLLDNSRNLVRPYVLRVKDGEEDASGLHSSPVLARVAVRDSKETTCGAGELPGKADLLGDCENNDDGVGPLVDGQVRVDLSASKSLGYYTFSALAQDKAGNTSVEISRLALFDDDQPIVAMGVTQGSNAKSEADHKLIATITDKLSVRDYSIGVGFGLLEADRVYYELKSADVDAYNADPLMKSVSLDEKITLSFLALQSVAEGAVADATPAMDLGISVRDHGDASADGDANDALSGEFDFGADVYASDDPVAVTFMLTAMNDSDASTFSFKASVTAAGNPFDRVMFYATADDESVADIDNGGLGAGDGTDLRLIATVEEYDARPSGDNWNYTAKVSAAALYAAVDGDGDYHGDVYAVGLSGKGERSGTSASVSTVAVVAKDSYTKRVDGELIADDGSARTVVVSGDPIPTDEDDAISFTATEGAGQTDPSKGPATRTVTTFTVGDDNLVPDATGTVTERIDTRLVGDGNWNLGTAKTIATGVRIVETGGVVTATKDDDDAETSDDTYVIVATAGSERLTVTTYAAGATATEDVAAKPALVSVARPQVVDER